ncbi:hypothetical protein [Algoriphagus aquimarinus]|uniref:hypothetical protein n=1 Tax=Algoriphagus aquimarinus TaxID=237018 RepID=UPI0030D74E9B|tara:strand:+ start:1832 stop:2200 length:369 start_codon:yes stop_codon:yes gene_type:complete
MKKQSESLKIDFKKKVVEGNFLAMVFANDGYEIAYIPSLNLSSYGTTKKEAVEMLNVSLKDFMDTLLEAGESKGTDEIKSLGWKRNPYFKKFDAPFVDKDGVLREFDLSEETKIETMSMAVA